MARSTSRPPEGRSFPLCFASKKEYDGWYEWAWREHHKSPAPNAHCEDCTAEYQRRMIAAGRCENPTAAFGIFA